MTTIDRGDPRVGEAAPAGGATADVVDAVRAVVASSVPADALEVARHCVLDWFGVTLAGTAEPLAAILRAELVGGQATGEAGIVGTGARATTSVAALVNGATSHALDYDDTHTAMSGHPTVTVLPAALAVAERDGRSGHDLLVALVAGVEAAGLVGWLVAPAHYRRGWHATGTVGTFAATAATATLLGLDRPAWLHAFGLAGSQAAGVKAAFGTMAKPFHAGKAAANGVLAATLAAAGFTASTEVLESDVGFAATFAEPLSRRVVPRDRLQVQDTLFKYHAACYLTHGVIESAHRLRREHGLAPDDIDGVELAVSPGVRGVCDIAEPTTGLEGKFSLRACAAMALLGDDTADPGSFSDRRMADADLVAVRDRTTLTTVADEPTTQGVLAVRTGDGRRLEARTDMSRPATDLAAQWERLGDKFRALAGPVLGTARTEALHRRVADLGDLDDVAELVELARVVER